MRLLIGDFENEEEYVSSGMSGRVYAFSPVECRIDKSDVKPVLKYRYVLRVSPSVYEGERKGESYYYSKVLTCRVVNM
jgi:hypothetical protein